MAPLTSVVVVTYNHADEIADCVAAARRQAAPDQRVEVIVVDNASTDGTAERAEAADPEAIVVRSPDNAGFAHGVNEGFGRSSGERVLLLNPDCVMDDGCLAALHRHLDAEPSVGAAAAALRSPDGAPQLFARRELTLPLVLWTLTDLGRRLDLRWRHGRGRDERAYRLEMEHGLGRPLEVVCAAGACLLVRRRDVDPALLDERFPLFFNDADLSRRLRARGLRTEIVPGATAVHGYGTSLRRADRSRIRADFTASMVEYVRHEWRRPARAALWMLLAVDGLTAIALGRLQRSDEAVQHGRGTLGGLGLPGGRAPWLAAPVPLSRALWRR